jgi:outer membrane protein assembly factor BamD (BamD/ComL family)
MFMHRQRPICRKRPQRSNDMTHLAAWLCALWGGMGSGCAAFSAPDPYDNSDIRAAHADAESIEKELKQKSKTDQFLGSLHPDEVIKSMKKVVGKGPNREYARQQYQKANELYEQARSMEDDARNAKFVEAAKLYVEAAARWPDTSLEQDAIFMSGEAYYFSDNYPYANTQYEKLLKKYPNSRHVDQAESRRFLIAQYWLESYEKKELAWYNPNFTDKERPLFDTGGNAHRLFDRIRIDDPAGKLADDATLAAANAHFRRKRFTKADEYYTDLRKAFPDSEHQWSAHFLGLKAKLLSYQGADYEGTSLDEADDLVRQIRRLFPKEAEEERSYLDRTYAEIRYKKGEKLWKKGEFHDRRAEFGAARYYYSRISEEFDDTPFGAQARERMKDTSNRPDNPPKYFQWLVDAFPQRDEIKPLLEKALIPPEERKRHQPKETETEAEDETPRVSSLSTD